MSSNLGDLYDIFSFSASTPADNDVVLHLRAEAESYATLELLRKQALEKGAIAYNEGPGKRRPRDWESLPEEDPVYQKEKKTKSAYISRFRAKEYEQLLEDKVEEGERFNKTKKNLLRQETNENDMLKEQIRRLKLQMAVHKQDDFFLEPAERKCPASPFSQVTGCSTPEKRVVPIPEISMDGFPLLPHNFVKHEDILVERWSSDESAESLLFQ